MKKKEQKTKKVINIIINKNFCKGCGYCVEFCKNDVLRLSEDYSDMGLHYAEIVDVDRCSGCGLCDLMCPCFCIKVLRIK